MNKTRLELALLFTAFGLAAVVSAGLPTAILL
jgi:hypothetical protein